MMNELGQETGHREARLRDHYDVWHGLRTGDATNWIDPRDRRFLRWAVGRLAPAPGATLLDVACGQGACLAVAEEVGLAAVGIDLSGVALGRAQSRLKAPRVAQGDAQRLPFADASFDHVTCLGSLEHFPEPAAGAREIARVLKGSGSALVFVPNLMFIGHLYFGLRYGTQPSEGDQQFSETFMTSRGWQGLLEGAGLRVQAVHGWNEIWATKKVSPNVVRLWNAASRFAPLNGAYAFGFVCGRA